MTPTLFRVKCMCSLSQGRAAGGTAETLPVEVESLGTDPLHHVDTPLAGVTLVTRRGERPSHRAALGNRIPAVMSPNVKSLNTDFHLLVCFYHSANPGE